MIFYIWPLAALLTFALARPRPQATEDVNGPGNSASDPSVKSVLPIGTEIDGTTAVKIPSGMVGTPTFRDSLSTFTPTACTLTGGSKGFAYGWSWAFAVKPGTRS